MIIREQGMVVGMIDDGTMKLMESKSEKLTNLVKTWSEEGVTVTGGTSDEGQEGEFDDGVVNIPYIPANLGFYHNQLLIEGFEVQRL